MLAGRTPFRAATMAQTIEMHLHARPPSVAGDHGAGEVPKKLADVIKKCLHKSPDDRFEDAEQLRAALLDAAGVGAVGDRTLPIAAPREHLSRRFLKQAARLKYSRIAALAAGTTLGLAAGYWLALALR
jgi:eukaryotic-like serine/threonine-protein kinase